MIGGRKVVVKRSLMQKRTMEEKRQQKDKTPQKTANERLHGPDKPDGAHFCSLHVQPVCECCSLLPASHQPVKHTLILILKVKGQWHMMVNDDKERKKTNIKILIERMTYILWYSGTS